MDAYVLTIDQGTTSSRAILYDQEKKIIAKAQRALNLSFPKPGWVEVDAIDLWHTVLAVLTEIISTPGLDTAKICSLAITNQRETTIIWDKNSGLPIAPAIVWQSRQTADICARWKEAGLTDLIHDKTGLPVDPYFSASKILFLLENTPGAKKRALDGELLFGTVDSWLIWKLTGGKRHLTDFSNASRTMLFNIHQACWDEELLQIMDIPPALLPELQESKGDFGSLDPALLLGLKIPIQAVLGDQQAALYGQRCLTEGSAKATFGTGGFILMNTGLRPIISKRGLLTTIAWSKDGKISYALEGSFFTAGSAVSWLINSLQLLDKPSELDQLAFSASDENVFFIPALNGLGTPWWNDKVRAAFVGMTQASGKSEIVRAVLEAIAFQTREITALMQKESSLLLKELKVDGGLVKSDYLLSFLSSILGIQIKRPGDFEATAMGAALMAGQRAGVWDEREAAAGLATVKEFLPTLSDKEAQSKITAWNQAVDSVLSNY